MHANAKCQDVGYYEPKERYKYDYYLSAKKTAENKKIAAFGTFCCLFTYDLFLLSLPFAVYPGQRVV